MRFGAIALVVSFDTQNDLASGTIAAWWALDTIYADGWESVRYSTRRLRLRCLEIKPGFECKHRQRRKQIAMTVLKRLKQFASSVVLVV